MWSTPLRMIIACAVLAWPLYPCCCSAQKMPTDSVAEASVPTTGMKAESCCPEEASAATSSKHPSDCPPSEACPMKGLLYGTTFSHDVASSSMVGSSNTGAFYEVHLFAYNLSADQIGVASHPTWHLDRTLSSGGRTLRALSCLLTV